MCFSWICYFVFNYRRYVRFCVIKLVSYGTEKLAKLLEYLLRHKAIQFNNNNYYTLNSTSNFKCELLNKKFTRTNNNELQFMSMKWKVSAHKKCNDVG